MERYGYDELMGDIYSLKCPCFSIGKTVMGRDIPALKIGGGTRPFLIVGAHHGREYISSRFIMRELKGISLDPDVVLYAVPMLNPDGVELSLNACPEWKANSRGVDLNENYPCLFYEKKSAPAPCGDGFKGYYPASEPEVTALMSFCEKIRPQAALTLHAKGEEIFYADENSPNISQKSLKIAQALAKISGYAIKPPSKDPAIYAAGFENWFRARFFRPCLLTELAPYDNSPVPYPVSVGERLTERARGIVSEFIKSAAKL